MFRPRKEPDTPLGISLDHAVLFALPSLCSALCPTHPTTVNEYLTLRVSFYLHLNYHTRALNQSKYPALTQPLLPSVI